MTAGIYKIENLLTGQVYIGQSIRVGRRFIQHRYELGRGIHRNPHLQAAWRKYGPSQFSFVQLCSVLGHTRDELVKNLNCYERLLIAEYGAFVTGYNLDTGGDGRVVSELTRQRLRDSHKGQKQRPVTQETREKLRIASTGRRHSAVTREKIQLSSVGRPAWNRGRSGYKVKPATAERKRKISDAQRGAKNHNFGKTIPAEVVAKIRDANCGSRCYLAKLNEAAVLDIKRRLQRGDRPVILAKEYGVARTQISAIRYGKTWKHVRLPEEGTT